MEMTHGSLFSGIGGFDLASEWMGWQNLFHCEWNEFGQKVLKHYWPNAELFIDIKKSNFTKYANKIDVLTGGFPCQPYSSAGKRLGKEDDRHLWPEMLRAIREIQPRYVVGENVCGLTNWNGGLVFDEVQADLEAEGYEVLPFLLPACAVNAPHRRDRIWFIAYSKKYGYSRNIKLRENIRIQERSIHQYKGEGRNEVRTESERFNEEQTFTNTNNTRTDIGVQSEQEWSESNINRRFTLTEFGENCNNWTTSNTDNNRHKPKRGEISKEDGVSQINRQEMGSRKFNGTDISRITSDTNNTRTDIGMRNQQEWSENDNEWKGQPQSEFRQNVNNGDVTNSSSIGYECRKERECSEGKSQPDDKQFKRFDKLFRGNFEMFPSVSPICNGDDGFPDRLDNITFPKWRNESIKAGGNAIVPQVAYQIFKAIEEYERINNTKTNNEMA